MIPRVLVLGVFGLVGCAQSPAPTPATPATPAVVVATPTPTPPDKTPVATSPAAPTPATQPVAAQPPKPPEPPTVFDYPTDLGGKSVVKAVTPTIATLPTEKYEAKPKPRTLPTRVFDPDAVTKAEFVPPPILPAKPSDAKPSAPPERVPLDLGYRSHEVPAKPTFPVSAGITERARDVNNPPTMAILGRPFNERVSLEDPTAEFSTAGIVAPLVSVSVPQTSFLRVNLPDPFELGEQIKPRVPPAADPGLAPVVVNPQRTK